jgi:CheY-like chemotaxis protein
MQSSTGTPSRKIGNEDRVSRVAVIDDHAAVRIGLKSAIGAQPGLVCVGVAGDRDEMEPLLYRTRPAVVVLDYHLPPANGLALCRKIKSDIPAPAVVLYSAYAGAALLVPAMLIDHTPPREIASTLQLATGELDRRVDRMLAAARFGGVGVAQRAVTGTPGPREVACRVEGSTAAPACHHPAVARSRAARR